MSDTKKWRGEWTTYIGQIATRLAASQKPEVPEEHRTAERQRFERAARSESERLTAHALRDNEEYRRGWQRKAAKGKTRKTDEESLLLQKAAMLAERYKGQPRQMVESHVLEPARTYLDLGLLDEAEMHFRAAQTLGIEDGRLAHALAAADPVRQEALAGIEAADELDRTWQIQVAHDLATLFGSGPQKAAASIARKNAEFAGLTFENNVREPEPDPAFKRLQDRIEGNREPVRPYGDPPVATRMRGDGLNFSRANDRLPGKRPRGD